MNAQITAEARPSRKAPPKSWGGTVGVRAWRVTLRYDGRRMGVDFFQGPAHKAPPTAADVVECLASDACSYEQAASFGAWCDEWGSNPDSRSEQALYRRVGAQTERLRGLLGDDFDAVVFSDEDEIARRCA